MPRVVWGVVLATLVVLVADVCADFVLDTVLDGRVEVNGAVLDLGPSSGRMSLRNLLNKVGDGMKLPLHPPGPPFLINHIVRTAEGVRYLASRPSPALAALADLPDTAAVERDLVGAQDGVEYTPAASGLSFSSVLLRFGSRYMGMASVEMLDICNGAGSQTLDVLSVASSNPQFLVSITRANHAVPSFTLAPGHNVTISVVFVPTEPGPHTAKLAVRTRAGVTSIDLQGFALPNPYGIPPIVRVSVVRGFLTEFVLSISNPTQEEFTVREAYTSGAFLYLDSIAPARAPLEQHTGWVLGPGETRNVLRVVIKADVARHYFGFVSVILSNRDSLLLPVSIRAVDTALHRGTERIDFGLLAAAVERRSLPFTLRNSLEHDVAVTSVSLMHVEGIKPSLTTAVTPAAPLKLPSGMDTARSVASLMMPSQTEGFSFGYLVVETNDTERSNKELRIPYRAHVLHGYIDYPAAATTFLIQPPGTATEQSLVLTNRFAQPLQLMQVTIEDSPHFKLVSAPPPGQISARGESWSAIQLQLMVPTAAAAMTSFTATLRLHVNLTEPVDIPLTAYHGRVLVDGHVSEASLDLGVMGLREVRAVMFNVSNPNPTTVRIYGVHSDATAAQVTLRLDSVTNSQGYATSQGSAAIELDRSDVSSSDDDPYLGLHAWIAGKLAQQPSSAIVTLPSGHSALFTADVRTSDEEERIMTMLTFATDAPLGKAAHLSLAYRSLAGSLTFHPSLVQFAPSFPGKVRNVTLSMTSTFRDAVTLTELSSNDVRVRVVLSNAVIAAGAVQQEIGYAVFDAAEIPAELNYMHEATEQDQQRLSAVTDPMRKADIAAVKRRDRLWQRLLVTGRADVRATISASSSIGVTGVTVPVHGVLTRPELAADLRFPLTQVGAVASAILTLRNPSDLPVHVVILPLAGRINQGCAVDQADEPSLEARLSATAYQALADAAETLISRPDRHRDFRLPANAVRSVILPAAGTADVGPIEFQPSRLGDLSTVLYMKNNLTILSTIELSGHAGSGVFAVEDVSGSYVDAQALAFPQAESRAAACDELLSLPSRDEPRASELLSSLTVRKGVRVCNPGNLLLHVSALRVSKGVIASGFALEGVDGAFDLQPGQCRELAIVHQPDYSSSVSQAYLQAETSQGAVSVAIEASVHSSDIATCYDAVRLPSAFDTYLRTLVVGVLIFVGGAIAMLAVTSLAAQSAVRIDVEHGGRDSSSLRVATTPPSSSGLHSASDLSSPQSPPAPSRPVVVLSPVLPPPSDKAQSYVPLTGLSAGSDRDVDDGSDEDNTGTAEDRASNASGSRSSAVGVDSEQVGDDDDDDDEVASVISRHSEQDPAAFSDNADHGDGLAEPADRAEDEDEDDDDDDGDSNDDVGGDDGDETAVPSADNEDMASVADADAVDYDAGDDASAVQSSMPDAEIDAALNLMFTILFHDLLDDEVEATVRASAAQRTAATGTAATQPPVRERESKAAKKRRKRAAREAAAERAQHGRAKATVSSSTAATATAAAASGSAQAPRKQERLRVIVPARASNAAGGKTGSSSGSSSCNSSSSGSSQRTAATASSPAKPTATDGVRPSSFYQALTGKAAPPVADVPRPVVAERKPLAQSQQQPQQGWRRGEERRGRGGMRGRAGRQQQPRQQHHPQHHRSGSDGAYQTLPRRGDRVAARNQRTRTGSDDTVEYARGGHVASPRKQDHHIPMPGHGRPRSGSDSALSAGRPSRLNPNAPTFAAPSLPAAALASNVAVAPSPSSGPTSGPTSGRQLPAPDPVTSRLWSAPEPELWADPPHAHPAKVSPAGSGAAAPAAAAPAPAATGLASLFSRSGFTLFGGSSFEPTPVEAAAAVTSSPPPQPPALFAPAPASGVPSSSSSGAEAKAFAPFSSFWRSGPGAGSVVEGTTPTLVPIAGSGSDSFFSSRGTAAAIANAQQPPPASPTLQHSRSVGTFDTKASRVPVGAPSSTPLRVHDQQPQSSQPPQ